MKSEEMRRILNDLGLGSKLKVISKETGVDYMFCCPYHGEKRPSCGISVEKQVGACFACGKTFHITELVMHVLDYSFQKAMDWLEERTNIDKKQSNKIYLRQFEDDIEKSDYEILPRIKLAPFKSGKVAPEYLLERGFTKDTLREFQVGWDSNLYRATIPVFDRLNNLQGFIGRAVVERDSTMYESLYGNTEKYHIYPPVKKSTILFPVNKLVETQEVILVEGTLDCLWMWQCGFKNTLSIITSTLHEYQVNLLEKLGIKSIVLALDNDDAGKRGIEKALKLLKGKFIVYGVDYVYKDPCDHSKEELEEIFSEKYLLGKKSLKKIS